MCELLAKAEEEALARGVHLLPPAAVSVGAMRGAGEAAPTTGELEGAIAAHCDALRARVAALHAQITLVVDEEWEPLHWAHGYTEAASGWFALALNVLAWIALT